MMNGNIVTTLFYVVALVVAFLAFFLYRKGSEARNGLLWLGLSYATVMAFASIAAGLMTIAHIPVNIITIGIVLLAAGVAGFALMIKDAKKNGKKLKDSFQKYSVEKFDIILTVFVTVFLGLIMYKAVGANLRYAYANADAGLHLREATTVVRQQRVVGMFYNHFQNALIIEALEPFFSIVEWYKAYMIADMFHVWLEGMFFALLIKRYLTTKTTKVIGLGVFALYFFGYPFFCYYYAFEYWGMGTMMIAYLILVLIEYKEAKVERKYTELMLAGGCFGVLTCYMLFAPFTYVLVLVSLMIVKGAEGKLFTIKNVLLGLKVFLFPGLLGFYYCFFDFFVRQGDTISGSISNSGGIYTELYIDFALLLIPLFFFFVNHIKNKKFDIPFVFVAAWLFFVLVMLVMVLKGIVSPYYYYKMYYPLWMLCWMAAMETIAYWQKHLNEMLISYVVLYVGMIVLCFGNVEYNIVNNPSHVTYGYHSPAIFTLYAWGKNWLYEEHPGQPADKMELYAWIIDNLGEEENIIPIMSENADYGATYFYEGVIGWDCGEYYGFRFSQEEITKRLEENNVKYITVLKSTDYFEYHEDALRKQEIIYENSAGMVIAL